MQFTSIAAFLAITIVGVAAAPGAYQPPKPTPSKPASPPQPPSSPPTQNTQTNTCSSGSPYCCSPSDVGPGTTCTLSTTQCNSVTICCNNAGFNSGNAVQSCSGTNTLQQPVQVIN